MRTAALMAVAFLVGMLVGAGLGALRWRPVVTSGLAALAGGLAGSLLAAAAWFRWPAPDAEVLAISIGLVEAVVSTAVILVMGLLIHYGVDALARTAPAVLAYRPALVGAVAAVIGVLGFAAGGAIRPMA